MDSASQDQSETTDASTDAELIERFQGRRDYAAFELLFARHKRVVLGFLIQLSGSTQAAEDISQHCWLRVIELAREGRLDASQGLKPLLMTMARNRYLDEHVKRSAASRTDPLDGIEEPAVDDTELGQQIDQQQAESELHRAVARLPIDQREVIALWSAGSSIKDMMAITGSPRDTVLSRKKYGLKKLRAGLQAP